MEIIEHERKKQLHDRVLERCAQLQASLFGLHSDPHTAKSERAHAVEQSLAALRTHLSGGWESIDECEALALTRWLRLSRFLVDGTSSAVARQP